MLRHSNPADDDHLADQDVDRDGVVDVPDDPRTLRDDGTLVSESDRYTEDQVAARRAEPVVATTEVNQVSEVEPAEQVTTERRFSWGQPLIMIAGAASLVLGIWAVIEAGLGGSLTEPTVEILGFDHTALLGLIEIGAGVLLLLAGLSPALRWLAALVGLAMIVGGVLILAELDWTQTELGAEQQFGWVPIGIGAAAFIGAMVPPTYRRVTTVR